MTDTPPPAVGDRLVLRLESLVHGGDAMGRHDGRVVFVPFAAPGELVEVEVTEARPDYLRARVTAVVEPSPYRVAPPCPYFGVCGGCQLQHLGYPAQLAAKTAIVAEQLRRIGGFADPPVRPTIGMVDPWHYRNHARFTARRRGEIGFTHVNHRWFIPIDYCLIMLPAINAALADIQGRAIGHRLHQVAIRASAVTGERLISPAIGDGLAPLLSGQRRLHDTLLGRTFQIAASSFFQVNTRPERRNLSDVLTDAPVAASQAEILVLLVKERLGLTGTERLVDAYCGVGAFALLLAPHCREVIAIEESASSLKDARANRTDGDRVTFVHGKTEDVLPTLGPPIDSVVIDPPRAGCRPEVLDALARLRPRSIAYVSCEPTTLARDVRVLVDRGFRLVETQPVDLFPQTRHIESVTVLRWEGAPVESEAVVQ